MAADGATVEIVSPHFSNRCAFLDPTHRRALSARFPEFIARGKPWTPSGAFAVVRSYVFQHRHDTEPLLEEGLFDIESIRLRFARVFQWTGVEAFANWKIDFYEFYLAFQLPARDIEAVFRVRKKES
ncbi:MAG: hypothetical protein M5R36_29255 [Deltaproteobacteria bacterium]|nr:hypothetical protein [Deltaproteobacteria bacterium]